VELKHREIESTNISRRSEIKLFSCDFYDMYPFRSNMPLPSQCRSMTWRHNFVARENFIKHRGNIAKCSGEEIGSF
jgi:hypothetical protein